ncbi:MAG TPA: right-handed parallel beta-helix repeat-containing protein [Pyrinomonadaceae bacterium]|jgi:hypothetical protein
MKRLACALATLAVVLWAQGTARASAAPGDGQNGGPGTTVVYPTGQHPADADNVQAAVSAGGGVLLKATDAAGVFTPFNFGPAVAGSGTVFLNADVSVRGETVAGRMTTITGGDTPFRINQPVESSFEGLNFEGPRMAAVYVRAAARFEFRRSRVARVVPFYWYTDGGVDMYKGQGLWVAVAGKSSGAVVIEENVFEDCGLGGAQLGYGLALTTGDAPLRVARNVIRGANFAGIILILPGAETVIEENTIVTGPGDVTPRYGGNGIHLLGAWRRVQDAPITFRKNEVSVEGPEAEGIRAFGDEVHNKKVQNLSIEENEINVTGGLVGIALWGEVIGARVRNNRLRGDARYGMLLGAGFYDPTEQSAGNQLTGNNIATFDASVADVFFDTNTVDNVLKGHGGSVIDLGIGNVITGARQGLPAHAEEQLRGAQRSMQRRPDLSEPDRANCP